MLTVQKCRITEKFARYLRKFSSNATRSDGIENTSSASAGAPLRGIRVLDLTRIIAGPYCTMILGDLGADVIKVEKPGSGDESRHWGPPFMPNSTDSVYFMASNRNKRSICVDMKRGRSILEDLARKCDVLVENYVPGKLKQFGLDYESLRKINERLIYCSITGYGSRGPYAKRPGYDVIAASMGGLLHITGAQDGPPAKVGVAMTDIATGLYAHGAILAALLARRDTGRGQKIDVDLLSTQVSCLINVASNYLNAGLEAKRWGTSHSSIVPYQAFKTTSGYVTIGAGSDAHFEALCKFLGIPEISSNPKFLTNTHRVEHRKELIELLEGIFQKKSTSEWMEVLKDAPFPVAPINSIRDVFEDEHVKAIGLVKSIPHPAAGSVKVVGSPVSYSEAVNSVRTAPPILGQHTAEVLQEVLEYSQEVVEKLMKEKIIQ
ncbi:succinate--hydroxymethylglutarate CoA-transferase [Lutzomyia longipalpis]|uniref:succinate--hydroxymethylglutarate CoA-transferase n=1 Tax=Lutzomyia longipalpis TaxID=7200 RepID=UPI00248337E1|nr:succinate--hydroxymethylglutarate CoA-transferase [Lutzomyia longipalpis]